MRARTLLAAGLVTIAVVACSKPAAQLADGTEAELAAELELALFAAQAGGTSAPVLSALELGRSSEPVQTPRPAPVPQKLETAVRSGPAVGQVVQPEPLVEKPALAEAPAGEEEVVGTAAVAAGDGEEHAGHGDVAARPARGGSSGPGIIIRGGGSTHDRCKLHLPGSDGPSDLLGAIGVMINDRTPHGIVGRDNPAYPTRGGGDGGVVPYPRGRGSFPGGIR